MAVVKIKHGSPPAGAGAYNNDYRSKKKTVEGEVDYTVTVPKGSTLVIIYED